MPLFNHEKVLDESFEESFYTQKSKFVLDFEGGVENEKQTNFDKYMEMAEEFQMKELIS